MSPRIWLVGVAIAIVSALATWLIVAPGSSRTGVLPGDADDARADILRLCTENEALRARIQEGNSRIGAAPVPPSLVGRSPSEPSAPSAGAADGQPDESATRAPRFIDRIPPASRDDAGLLAELAKREDLRRILREIAWDVGIAERVRVTAVAALLAADPEPTLVLVGRLRTSADEADRRTAFRVLTTISDPWLQPQIQSALGSPDRPEDAAALSHANARAKGPAWGAAQTTGTPDTFEAGDQKTAWACKQADMGEVWLELDFTTPVLPEAVRVHETFNPGAVARVEAKSSGAAGYEVLWEGRGASATAPHWFEPPLSRASGAVRTIRLVLDTDRISGWNEIDAVELVGDGRSQWAIRARASSSYGGS